MTTEDLLLIVEALGQYYNTCAKFVAHGVTVVSPYILSLGGYMQQALSAAARELHPHILSLSVYANQALDMVPMDQIYLYLAPLYPYISPILNRLPALEHILPVFTLSMAYKAFENMVPEQFRAKNYTADLRGLHESCNSYISCLPWWVKTPIESLYALLSTTPLYDYFRFGLGVTNLYFFPYAFCYSVAMNVGGYLLSRFILELIDRKSELEKKDKFQYAKQAAGLSSTTANLIGIFVGNSSAVVLTSLLISCLFSCAKFGHHLSSENSAATLPPETQIEAEDSNPTKPTSENFQYLTNTRAYITETAAWLAAKGITQGYESIYFAALVLHTPVLCLWWLLDQTANHPEGPETLKSCARKCADSLPQLQNGFNAYVGSLESTWQGYTDKYFIEPAVNMVL